MVPRNQTKKLYHPGCLGQVARFTASLPTDANTVGEAWGGVRRGIRGAGEEEITEKVIRECAKGRRGGGSNENDVEGSSVLQKYLSKLGQ